MTTYPTTDEEIIQYIQKWIDENPVNEVTIINGADSLTILDVVREMRAQSDIGRQLLSMYSEGFKIISEY